jgi:hypothetical protein
MKMTQDTNFVQKNGGKDPLTVNNTPFIKH